MAGYTRQSVADILNGIEVTAPPLNKEFNQIAAAFDGATGHAHDGSSGDAPKINLDSSVSGYLPAVHGGVGGLNKTDATTNPSITNDTSQGYAPGSLWLNVSTDRVFVCVDDTSAAAIWHEVARITENNVFFPETNDTVDLGLAAQRFKDLYLSGAADIQGNVSVGGTLSVTGGTTLGTVTTTGTTTVATADVNGGNIDGTVIGNTTPAAVTGTTITANTGFSGDLTGNVTGDVTGNLTGNVTGNVTGDLTGDVTSSGTSTFQDVTISGTLNLDAGTTATITGLSTPVNTTDAATKGYVDTEVAAVIDAAPGALDTLNELAAALGDDANFSTTVTNSLATKLNLSGGTMSGQINMGSNKIVNVATPTAGTDATTKAYVDGVDATKLNLSGGTMTGNLAMGANKVTSTAAPTTADDLTRKGYVDGILGSATSAETSANNAADSAADAEKLAVNPEDTQYTLSDGTTTGFSALHHAAKAEASATAAAASYDSFDDRYLGVKSSDPATDNDGNALLTGAIYWNDVDNRLRIYDGAAWQQAVFSTAGAVLLNNWEITESGGALYFATGGTNYMKLDATGNLQVAGTVEANATIS